MKIQIAIGGKTYEVEVEVEGGEDAVGGPHSAGIEMLQSARVPTAPRPGSSSESEEDASESQVCRSPVAGIVVRVCVQAGDQLQPDDLLVVLEAMKMETSVTAPTAGKVKAVRVTPGEAVKLNQVLVEFE